jgi:hypothetical protein
MICYPEMGVALGYDSRRLVSTREMAKYTYLRGFAGDDFFYNGVAQLLFSARVQRGSSNFPHFALRGAARLSFTARIEGAHSDRAASASKKDGLAVSLPLFQARLFSLRDGG